MMSAKRKMHQWSIEKSREEKRMQGRYYSIDWLMNRRRRRERTIFE